MYGMIMSPAKTTPGSGRYTSRPSWVSPPRVGYSTNSTPPTVRVSLALMS
jgi:hypothetical protein